MMAAGNRRAERLMDPSGSSPPSPHSGLRDLSTPALPSPPVKPVVRKVLGINYDANVCFLKNTYSSTLHFTRFKVLSYRNITLARKHAGGGFCWGRPAVRILIHLTWQHLGSLTSRGLLGLYLAWPIWRLDVQSLHGESRDGRRERGREGGNGPASRPPPSPLPSVTESPFILIFLQSVGPPYAFTENIIKEAKGALIWTSSIYIYLHCLLMRLSTLLHQSWICVDWLKRWTLVKIFVTQE